MSRLQGVEPQTRFRRYALSNIARRHLLALGERVVLSELIERADYRSWTWQGSASELARDAGLNRETISAAVPKLEQKGLVSIVEPFRPYHKAIIRLDCYGELVVGAKDPTTHSAEIPAIADVKARIAEGSAARIAGPIAGPIAETAAAATGLNSHFVEAPNRATEKQINGDWSRAQLSYERRASELEESGRAASALGVIRDDKPPIHLAGRVTPLSCPDCGGWPCQCVF